MNFIDKVTIKVFAGSGGDGAKSFRHEKFIDKGGPDGGDGGNGGNIVFVATRNENTLSNFRYQKELKAEDGQAGSKTRKHGRSGGDHIARVPVGTIITNEEGEILADLVQDEQRKVIAAGGRGGFGNAHFISSTRQAPNFAEKGEPGQAKTLVLELKMIADVGLVGLPNAGKSTFLSSVSNARPEIADYAFTTLTPNLGVVDVDAHTSLLFADIPGLIEGAADGKGLGHEFLRHVERTSVLVHLIDAYQEDIVEAYRTIQGELGSYSKILAEKSQIIALNKTEGLDKKMVADLLKRMRRAAPKGTPLFAISAQAHQGITEVLYAVKEAVLRAQEQSEQAAAEGTNIPVISIESTELAWRVTKEKSYFMVTGTRIEKFALRTDFTNEQGVRRLRDIMKKMGIMHELLRQGLEAGQEVRIGQIGHFEY